MPSVQDKKLITLKIDQEFHDLIRPLFKSEYLQLEANLISDGCREPISVWHGIITAIRFVQSTVYPLRLKR